ncbi:hypothetical protein FB45DRAFT_786887 [Roridomyces roridus]|uniref:CcmS related domain-containing protein n=1 Tax=Roridomyces roridus TaxID=1738132 RepID=A0AAD7FTL9_9AGAR|nr:hypothetical protein FB45DRAFT_786887 [Roridomyces roridus]
MPSKTLAHAQQGTTTPLFTGAPRNKVSEGADVQFVDSKGEALKFVHQALFGKGRKAKDRIHWLFSPDKDERVSSLLHWIDLMSYNLGAYGLHRFLQSREKGALIANADYRPNHVRANSHQILWLIHFQSPNEPAFDWLTFDDLQLTKDKILQESVAFYDPAVTCIVFVFLPSKSGNSVAMWRRKISVGNNTRASRINEIRLAKAALRREKDYIVHVDEIPGGKLPEARAKAAGASKAALKPYDPYDPYDPYHHYSPYDTAVEKPRKRRWYEFFCM